MVTFIPWGRYAFSSVPPEISTPLSVADGRYMRFVPVVSLSVVGYVHHPAPDSESPLKTAAVPFLLLFIVIVSVAPGNAREAYAQ